MRKIEFRGQILGTTEWVRGNLLSYPDVGLYLIEFKEDEHYIKKQVDKNTIGQFTCMLDKNSNEICEGDIVIVPDGYSGDYHYNKNLGVIIYEDNCFCIDTKNLSEYNWNQLEVIGNIYDDKGILMVKNII